MRRDVQEIFRMTPHEKQVMMFSATLSKDMRVVCKKFMQDVNICCCSQPVVEIIVSFLMHCHTHYHFCNQNSYHYQYNRSYSNF